MTHYEERLDKDLSDIRAQIAEMAGLVDELEVNPLPESFEVFLAPGSGAEAVGAQASVMPIKAAAKFDLRRLVPPAAHDIESGVKRDQYAGSE